MAPGEPAGDAAGAGADTDVPCCGCSCHVCESGHNAGFGPHTDGCRDRVFAAAQRRVLEAN